jgi:hypothetical protein
MKPETRWFFNRHYATEDSCHSTYPALKGRAKFSPTLRVDLSDSIATFAAKPWLTIRRARNSDQLIGERLNLSPLNSLSRHREK